MTTSSLGLATVSGAHTLELRTFEEWQQHMSNRFVRVQVSTDRPTNFRALLCDRKFDDISVSRFEVDAHQQVDRLQEFIRPDEQRFFKLSMILGGSGLVVQDGREALLGPGDIAIYDTSRPYTAMFDEADSLVMIFEQEALSVPGDLVGQLTATAMSSTRGMGRVIAPFLRELATNLDGFRGHAGNMLAHNTLDLINTLVYSELDLGERRADPRLDALAAVKDYIDRHLASARLSPASIAAANYMSTRRLHYLFEGAGATVANFIKARRLERCRLDLVDPSMAGLTITQISSRWGFVDSAHFSRAFKTAYGTSPSRFRELHGN